MYQQLGNTHVKLGSYAEANIAYAKMLAFALITYDQKREL